MVSGRELLLKANCLEELMELPGRLDMLLLTNRVHVKVLKEFPEHLRHLLQGMVLPKLPLSVQYLTGKVAFIPWIARILMLNRFLRRLRREII